MLLAGCGGDGGRPDLSLLDDGVLRVGVLRACPAALPELPGRVLGGCLNGDPERAVEEARRLIEGEDADVVLAYPDDEEGYALALYGRTQPDRTFVLGSSALQAATLDIAAPNVFRYAPDAAQRAAGLGLHAYRELGWRRASIERAPTQFALEQAHAFAAEFCRLGGELVERGGDGAFVSDGREARVGEVRAEATAEDAAARLRAALARVSDLSDGHAALRKELGRGLDENNQVVVEVRLVEGERVVRRLGGVEQTLGGAFTPETSPPEDEPECDR